MAIEQEFRTVHEDGTSGPRETAAVIRALMDGKMNNRLDIELELNQASTTIVYERIGPESAIILVPLDANAAAEAWWISSQGEGSAVIGHASNATTRAFRCAVIG